jgi:hypothetical protein
VTTKQPTLVAGERDRARSWGETLAANTLTELQTSKQQYPSREVDPRTEPVG